MTKITVGELGGYIRDQRNSAQISLRQLAKLAGVSNPYLSQIERGLRRPSAEILQQIAKALRISAEALYVQAGMLDARPDDSTVTDSVLSDRTLTDRQKQVLLEVYDSFRRENDCRPAASDGADVADPVASRVLPAGLPEVVPARRAPRGRARSARRSGPDQATADKAGTATSDEASLGKAAAGKAGAGKAGAGKAGAGQAGAGQAGAGQAGAGSAGAGKAVRRKAG